MNNITISKSDDGENENLQNETTIAPKIKIFENDIISLTQIDDQS